MAKPGKIFRLIKNQNRRQQLFEKYIHHKNIYNKGESELGFIRSFFGFQSYMVAWLFLRDIIPGIPVYWAVAAFPLLAAAKISLYYCIGLFWERNRMFDLEHSWQNNRDPIAKMLSRKVGEGQGLDLEIEQIDLRGT